jgi:hypothetical protein
MEPVLNHGTSAKPWNECRKTVEVPREIRRIPSTIYTHPTAKLVPGNFNEHVGHSLTSGSLGSLESLLNVNEHSHPVSFHVQATRRKRAKPKNPRK